MVWERQRTRQVAGTVGALESEDVHVAGSGMGKVNRGDIIPAQDSQPSLESLSSLSQVSTTIVPPATRSPRPPKLLPGYRFACTALRMFASSLGHAAWVYVRFITALSSLRQPTP